MHPLNAFFVLSSKGNNNVLTGHNPGLEYVNVIAIGKGKKKSRILHLPSCALLIFWPHYLEVDMYQVFENPVTVNT